MCTILFLFMYLCCESFIAPASRRIFNCSFTFWTLFFFFSQISISNFIDIEQSTFHSLTSNQEELAVGKKSLKADSKNNETSLNEKSNLVTCQVRFGGVLVDAINCSPLLTFLIANLLTGLVNMTIQSLLLGPITSIVIIFTYGFIIVSVAYFLKMYSPLKKKS